MFPVNKSVLYCRDRGLPVKKWRAALQAERERERGRGTKHRIKQEIRGKNGDGESQIGRSDVRWRGGMLTGRASTIHCSVAKGRGVDSPLKDGDGCYPAVRHVPLWGPEGPRRCLPPAVRPLAPSPSALFQHLEPV